MNVQIDEQSSEVQLHTRNITVDVNVGEMILTEIEILVTQ